MREDMARVLVGRPRSGMRLRLKRRKLHQNDRRRPDEAMRYEPMSRGRGTKWLNENLSPLERFLRRQVGRPWDLVYSEISARLRPTNAVQQHVRDHVFDFVAIDTWLEDGDVVVQGRFGGRVVLSDSGWGPDFYVCPRSGLLRERRRRSSHPTAAPDLDVRWEGSWRQLRRIDSIWYALELAPIPESTRERMAVRDLLFSKTLQLLLNAKRGRDPLAEAYGRAGVYAAAKQQLGKRDLRRLDLPGRDGAGGRR